MLSMRELLCPPPRESGRTRYNLILGNLTAQVVTVVRKKYMAGTQQAIERIIRIGVLLDIFSL